MPEALPSDLPPRVERAAKFLLESGHAMPSAVAMAHNAFGKGKVHPVARRSRELRMSPDELEQFSWSLVNRSTLLEGTLLSLDGGDVREGMVASAHALCEAGDAKRPVKLALGGGPAAREKVDAARSRISAELSRLGELIEAAKPKDAGPLSMKTAGGPKANPRVVHLQNRLNSLGHQLQADGKFGEVTAEAVKDFQTKIDVDPSGEVDDMTAEALRNGGRPKPTPEEVESQKQALAARQQGNKPAEGGEQNSGEPQRAGSATTSNGDSAGGRSRTVTIKLSEAELAQALAQEADAKGDMPQAQMPSACPKCGAPVRKGGVCQRGHRVLGAPSEYKPYGPLDEAWSDADRAKALAARRGHGHGYVPFNKGDKVEGSYFGHKITGTVTEHRHDTMNHERRHVHVSLDKSITHNGTERTGLHFEVDAAGLSSGSHLSAPGSSGYLRPAKALGDGYKRYKRDDMRHDFNRGDMDEASSGSLDPAWFDESAQTAALSSTHAPIGKGGTNWVTRSKPGNTGQLPAYIQNIRNALIRGGHSESSATAIAVGTCKRWAAGGGNVHSEVRAAAAKALAEWESMRGKAHVEKAAKKA